MANKKNFLSGYKTYDTTDGLGSESEWKSALYNRIGAEEAKKILDGKTPHEVLGVSSNATKEEIKKAFRMLLLDWHPDRNPSIREEAEAKTKEIISAYSLIPKE